MGSRGICLERSEAVQQESGRFMSPGGLAYKALHGESSMVKGDPNHLYMEKANELSSC